jgi:hypothetical protein
LFQKNRKHIAEPCAERGALHFMWWIKFPASKAAQKNKSTRNPYLSPINRLCKNADTMIRTTTLLKGWGFAALTLAALLAGRPAQASSHREAPLIAQDPQADNTDLYVFRSPDDTNTVTIIANYVPFQVPESGPNYYTFGENIRYEIHISNNTATSSDDITYRFTFSVSDDDPTTFFNTRFGKRNQRTTWTLTKFTYGGSQFGNVIATGTCPPPNIGPRSIEGQAGLSLPSYDTLVKQGIVTAGGSAAKGERVFCGPADDPYFADIAGLFDFGNVRPKSNGINEPRDGFARFNVSTIAMKIPITTLQKAGQSLSQSRGMLDPDFVIGVWASASRREVTALGNGTVSFPGGMSNGWVQVSRLGMPLSNELFIPIGKKDLWNARTPASDAQFQRYFTNPELALYMYGSGLYGQAVPALNELRIQQASRPDIVPGGFDFRNDSKGLWPLKGINLANTALDPAGFGNFLLPDSSSPRSVDLLAMFYTGFPNQAPYQLGGNKAGGDIFAAGKPFVNNFLPTMGDMLRLNMTVPVTPRNSPEFSSLGLMAAINLGLTQAPYNTNKDLEWIPNMDGFPNGRRLEDDVVTIEMQAVGGAVLAAMGLWFDDFEPGGAPDTKNLQRTFRFSAGPSKNDTTFKTTFPYVQLPWRGVDYDPQPRF